MTDQQLTPLELTMQALQTEWQVLTRTDYLVGRLWTLLDQIRTDGTDARPDDLADALATWNELDELGVDLSVPNLKTLLVSQAASHPTSDGGDDAAAPDDAEPSSEQTSGEAVTPQSTPSALSDLTADEPPASSDPTEQES